MSVKKIYLESRSSNCYSLREYNNELFKKIIIFEMALKNAREAHFVFNGNVSGEIINLKLVAKYNKKNQLIFLERGVISLLCAYAKKINFRSALKSLYMYPFSKKYRRQVKDVFRAMCMNNIERKFVD